MYLDETAYNEWSIAKAIDSYSIIYPESSVVSRKLKTDLEVICRNPNILKAAKEKAQLLLKQWKETKPKKRSATSTVSAGSPSATAPLATTSIRLTFYRLVSHPAPDTALDTGQGTAQGTAQDTAQDAASSTQKGIAITGPLRKKRNIDHVSHDEIDALFNSLQDHEEEEIGPVCLRDQPSAVLRPPLSHYIINDINVSRKFYEYQLEDKAVMETHGFVIETSAFELLSLSSIMLLKPRQYSSMIRLKQIESALKTPLFGQSESAIDENLSTNIYKIVKKLIKDQNRVEAIKSLSLLLPCKDRASARIICILPDMVLTPPIHEITSSSGEINLCVECLDPGMRHIFNDDEAEVLLQWPNTLVLDGSQKRPDATAFILDQDSYSIPVAFGEAKLPTASHILLVKDLLRIAMFSKDSIDTNSLSSIISFQAVGKQVSFYIMQLKEDGLYIILELYALELPSCINDLMKFSLIVDDLLAVIKAARLSKQSSRSSPNTHKRPSYYSPQYRNFLHKKR